MMDTSSNQKKVIVSLEDLRKYKVEILQEIKTKKVDISQTSNEILAPVSMMINIVSSLRKGLNLLNGLQTGIKAVKLIRTIFGK